LNGIENKVSSVSSWFGNLASNVVSWIGNVASTLLAKGRDILDGFWDGIKEKWDSVKSWLGSMDDKAKSAVGDLGNILKNIGMDIINGLWNGMKDKWNQVTGWLGSLGGAIQGLKGPPEKDKVLLVENGMLIFQGLQKGMEDEWDNVALWLSQIDPSAELDPNIGTKMAQVINASMPEIDINPTITPVLDLTQVQQDAKKLKQMLPENSTMQAGIIAGYNPGQAKVTDNTSTTPEITFTQNINAPKQLSTADIYRQTRNQIAMAKEELSIP